MYDLISSIINHPYTGAAGDDFIYAVASTLIVIVTICLIDLIYRVFSHFWRG